MSNITPACPKCGRVAGVSARKSLLAEFACKPCGIAFTIHGPTRLNLKDDPPLRVGHWQHNRREAG